MDSKLVNLYLINYIFVFAKLVFSVCKNQPNNAAGTNVPGIVRREPESPALFRQLSLIRKIHLFVLIY